MADNEKSLLVKLLFGVDQGSAQQAKSAVDQITKKGGSTGLTEAGRANVTAAGKAQGIDDLLAAYDKAIASKQKIPFIESFELIANAEKTAALSEAEFTQKVEEAGIAAKEVLKHTTGIRTETEKAVKQISLMEAGEALNRIGTGLRNVGMGALSPIQKYVQSSGTSDEASQKWLNAQKSLEQSTIRIGAVLTREVAPKMEKAAQLASKVAEFVEAHPEIAKMAAGLAMGAAVGGTLLQVSGMAVQTAGAFGKLAPYLKGVGGIGGVGGVGGIAGLVGSIGKLVMTLGPLAIAITALVALLNTKFGQSGVTAGKQLLALGAGTIGGAIGGDDKAREWMQKASQALGLLGNTAQTAAGQFANAADGLNSKSAVDAYISYQEESAQAEEQYEQERAKIVDEAGRRRVDLEKQYEQQRSSIIAETAKAMSEAGNKYQNDVKSENANYATETKRAQTKLNDDMAKIRRDAQRAEVDAERQHELQLKQMQEDHEFKMSELADKRDALGMINEIRRYNLERQRANESYNADREARQADAAQRIVDLQAQFAEEAAQRKLDHKQKLNDLRTQYTQETDQIKQQETEKLAALAASHQQEMDQLKQDTDQKLTDLKSSYTQEQAMRKSAFEAQLRDLGIFLGSSAEMWQEYYQAMANALKQQAAAGDFNSSPDDKKSKKSGKRYASGGYTGNSPEWAIVDPGEYVLTKDTTRALESALRGTLTQGRILQTLAGRMNSNTITWNDQRKFSGELTPNMRATINRDTLDQLATVLGGA